MEKELKKYFQKKLLISIYADEENMDKFLTGYINRFDDDGIIISHVTPYGTYDGYVYVKKKDVFRIETNSKYIKKLEKLILVNDTKRHEEISIQPNQSLLLSFFSFVQKMHKLIRIQVEDEYALPIMGFVRRIDNEWLVLDQVDEEGEKNGITLVRIDTIYDCESDTVDEQIIMQIYDYNATQLEVK